MRIRNVDALGGPRELPDHGLLVENQAEVDVPDELGESLIQQPAVWERVEEKPKQEQGDKK